MGSRCVAASGIIFKKENLFNKKYWAGSQCHVVTLNVTVASPKMMTIASPKMTYHCQPIASPKMTDHCQPQNDVTIASPKMSPLI